MEKPSKKEAVKIEKIISRLEEVIAIDKGTIEQLTVYPHRVKDSTYKNVEWQGGNCHGLLVALEIVKTIKDEAR